MTIRIRDAAPDDAGIIADYNSRLSEETEGEALDPELIGPGVAAVLADASKGRYWVAESDGVVVGQIMVTMEWSDWRNGMLWWIQSVYVREDHRKSGVFSKLYRHVEEEAQDIGGIVGLRLYVEQDNDRAVAVYKRLGLKMTGYRVMQSLFSAKERKENKNAESGK